MLGTRATLRATVLTVAGRLLTLTGIVLFPLPGPGLLLIFLGLLLLAEQYDWAARRVQRLRGAALLSAARGVQTPLRAVGSVVSTLLLTASGALWLWEPAQPDWWLLPAWSWLPGGFWTGISQIGSGLVTLVLVLYAISARRGGRRWSARAAPRCTTRRSPRP